MSRTALPHRRPCATRSLEIGGQVAHLTVGFDPAGQPKECFARLRKPGSDLDQLLDDVAVLVSIALQSGVTPAELAHSMARLGSGGRASLVGHVIDALVSEGG